MKRQLKEHILNDLKKKMIFITGPRQVGKTWLAKDIAKKYKNPLYLNYDSIEDRLIIKDKSWLEIDILILDEIHKMPDWKTYLKGLFDTKDGTFHILVTGSARLETFKSSGESLAGRYFSYRLLPLTMKELKTDNENTLKKLTDRGGFPEPYLAKNSDDAQKWRKQYSEGLIRDDILDFEKIHDFKAIKLLFELLRLRVGSPVSLTSLAEDIGISPNTVKKYIEIFESLYLIFRVTTYSKNIARSLKKEYKIYFFDTGLVNGDEGIKFENMVSISLLKHLIYLEDIKGIEAKLYYLKTKEGKEVDFALVQNGKIELIMEVKNQKADIPKQLQYFNDKYQLKSILLLKKTKHQKVINGVEIRVAHKFLNKLEA